MMKSETVERWRTLCQQAQTEQDPEKFMEIIEEITRLLEEKEQRLRNQETKDQPR
jgi:hypothetical protein